MKKKQLLRWSRLLSLIAAMLIFSISAMSQAKNGPLGICYVEVNNNNILNAGAYTLKNGGQQVFDVAIVFAANLNYDVAKGRPYLYANNNVTKVLSNAATYIQPLQAKGIKVLLDVLGNHQGAGICNFTSRAQAKDFALQIAHTVNTYGLDGIDFDDEYSDYGTNGTGQPNDSSFVMLVQEVRALLPTKIISFYYYGPAASRLSWNGYRVGDYVDYSWNAIYGSFSNPNVPPLGSDKKSPAAVWIGNTSTSTVTSLANQTKSGNYGLFLWYDLHGSNEATYLSAGTVPLYNDSAKLTGTLQSWTAGASCDAPIGLTVSNLTGASATVSWTAVGSNNYTVDYKTAAASTWTNAASGTTGTSVNISGLTANTEYDWRVRTNCTSSTSTYSFAPRFNSGSGPVTSPGPRSLYFDGTNEYVNTGSINLSGSALSFEGWIKPAAFKSASPYISSIIGTETSDANAALLRLGDASVANNKLQFVLSIGGSQKKLAAVSTLSTNTWYHVAATYDGATMKLYINGVLDASVAQTGAVTANGVFYISRSWDDSRCFNGWMDEMRVWKKALTATEIQNNKCSTSPSSTSLEGYWRFNDGSGTSAQDTTGHNYTGSLTNMDNSNWRTDVPTCAPVLPVANFTGTPVAVATGQSVTFTNSSTNATSYSWTFTGGSPATSTATNPVVTYNTAGTYTVKLVATNANGSDSLIRTNYITVSAALNYAISLDGTNEYLQSNTVNLSGSALSMEAWVKPNGFKAAFPNISTLMGIESGTNAALLRFGDDGLANNKLQFVLSIGGAQKKLASATTFSTGTWYHIAATYDGATMKLYVNGVLDASVAQTGAVTANATFYLSYSYDASRCLNGIIDEARVWKKALTATEVANNACTVPGSSTSLEAYWKLNEGSGTSAADATGKGHSLTLTNTESADWVTDVPSACGGAASRQAVIPVAEITAVVNETAVAWPNPVAKNKSVSISLKELTGHPRITLYNTMGAVMKTQNINATVTQVPLTGFSAGIYYYAIKTADGKLLHKGSIVVQ
ncbi:MAG: PKD domain-containing protein [Ferruginibacter sp.]